MKQTLYTNGYYRASAFFDAKIHGSDPFRSFRFFPYMVFVITNVNKYKKQALEMFCILFSEESALRLSVKYTLQTYEIYIFSFV